MKFQPKSILALLLLVAPPIGLFVAAREAASWRPQKLCSIPETGGVDFGAALEISPDGRVLTSSFDLGNLGNASLRRSATIVTTYDLQKGAVVSHKETSNARYKLPQVKCTDSKGDVARLIFNDPEKKASLQVRYANGLLRTYHVAEPPESYAALMEFSADETQVVVCSGSQTVWLDVRDGHTVRRVKWSLRFDANNFSASLLPRGEIVAVANKKFISLYSIDGKIIRRLRAVTPEDEGESGVWHSPDGTLVAATNSQGITDFWRVSDGQKFWTGDMPDLSAFTPDSRFVASIGLKAFELRNAQTGKLEKHFSTPHLQDGQFNQSFVFSPDSSTVYWDDGEGTLWKERIQ